MILELPQVESPSDDCANFAQERMVESWISQLKTFKQTGIICLPGIVSTVFAEYYSAPLSNVQAKSEIFANKSTLNGVR